MFISQKRAFSNEAENYHQKNYHQMISKKPLFLGNYRNPKNH